MRVLVCGSREWDDQRAVDAAIFGVMAFMGDDVEVVVIDGGARGADACAAEWCRAFMRDDDPNHRHERYPADWGVGRVGGLIRNQRMLDEGHPDVVIAFKDGFQRDTVKVQQYTEATVTVRARGGTEDMVRRAKAAGIPVYIVSHG